MNDRRLKVGILSFDGTTTLALDKLREEIERLPFVECMIFSAKKHQPMVCPPLPWIARMYLALDRFLLARLSRIPDPAGPPVNRQAPTTQLPASTIKDLQPDILIDTGSEDDAYADYASSTRHGIWFGSRNCLGAMVRGDTVLANKVVRIAPSGDRQILYCCMTGVNQFSHQVCESRARWDFNSHVICLLRRLHETGELAILEPGRADPEIGSIEFLGWLPRLIVRLATKLVKTLLGRDIWVVGLSADGTLEFHELKSSPGTYLADPFPVSVGPLRLLFYEEYKYVEEKGRLMCAEIDQGFELRNPRPVLEAPYHLSFPFVFEDEGNFWMVPESKRSSAISLYRCTLSPFQWEFERDLMSNVSAVDTILIKHQGLYWMFTTLAKPESGTTDELFLFYSDTLSSDWTSHPMNPVVSDARVARCAGRLFMCDGDWFRPGQDCSVRYGRSVVFNRIIEWTVDRYEESPESEFDGGWCRNGQGAHTWNTDGSVVAVDGAVWQPFWKKSGTR